MKTPKIETMKTSETGRKETIDLQRGSSALLQDSYWGHVLTCAALINLLKPYECPPLAHSPFIAAFGKNNAKKHYRPFTGIDVADEAGALNVALRRGEGSEDSYKHAKQVIKHT